MSEIDDMLGRRAAAYTRDLDRAVTRAEGVDDPARQERYVARGLEALDRDAKVYAQEGPEGSQTRAVFNGIDAAIGDDGSVDLSKLHRADDLPQEVQNLYTQLERADTILKSSVNAPAPVEERSVYEPDAEMRIDDQESLRAAFNIKATLQSSTATINSTLEFSQDDDPDMQRIVLETTRDVVLDTLSNPDVVKGAEVLFADIKNRLTMDGEPVVVDPEAFAMFSEEVAALEQAFDALEQRIEALPQVQPQTVQP